MSKSHETCAVCGRRVPSVKVMYDPTNRIFVCMECFGDGKYGEYVMQMESSCGVKTKEETVAKEKVIFLDDKLWCPSCANYTLDQDTGRCSTVACKQEKDIKPADLLRMLLEFAEWLCPFCLHINHSTGDKTCKHDGCKARLGHKKMKRRYRTDRGARVEGERCSICGSNNVWGKIKYCMECHMTYGATIDGFVAEIDGSQEDAASRRIVIHKPTGELNRVFSIPKDTTHKFLAQIMEEFNGTGGGAGQTGDQTEKLPNEITVTPQEYSAVELVEAVITVKKVDIEVRLECEKNNPTEYAIRCITIPRLKEDILPNIPEALKELLAEEAKNEKKS